MARIDLDTMLSSMLKSDEGKEISNIINGYVSKCSSIVEFGSRGGVSGAILMNALIKGAKSKKWMPRYVGVDLVQDQSIDILKRIADENGISFHFWKGHTNHYPIHETDVLVWDTFHAGGSLIRDLDRLSPYIHKYVVIFGVLTFADKSESGFGNNDLSLVAKELGIDEAGAKMSIREGIDIFLKRNPDWYIIRDFHEICVLARKNPCPNALFETTA
jgi:hypothetical protein